MRRLWVIASWVLLVSLGYAVIRYIVWGGVPLAQLPVFISNKAVAVVGLVLLGTASVANGSSRAAYGTAGMSMVLLHVVLSLIVLTPPYLGKLFAADGHLTAAGEWSMLFGSVALLLVCRLAIRPTETSGSGSLIRGAGQWVLALTALHVLALGFPSWTNPAHWPGHLPPISLLSCVVAIGFLLARRSGWRLPSGHRASPPTGE